MEYWNKLATWQKVLVGALLIGAAFIMPELMFFYDIGGMELMFGFAVMYLQSIKAYYHSKVAAFKQAIATFTIALSSTLVFDRRVFWVQASFCILVFGFTGSLYLASLFVFPGALLTGANGLT